MRVLSIPGLNRMGAGESGIHTVIRNWYKHAEKYGIEFVDGKDDKFDIVAAHAGITGNQCHVAHLHGIYFTGDYPATRWQHICNKNIVSAVRYATAVTVPSKWVREVFQRDMRFSPIVLPHGVDWEAWQHDLPTMNYVLGYAKNRSGADVCDPSYLTELAKRMPKVNFKSTFHPDGAPPNVDTTGVIPYRQMMILTQQSAVFVQAVKETFGLHALEAIAAGVPVVAYNHGGVIDFVKHGVNGYLAEPGDIDDLAEGINYCLKYRHKLGENGRELAKLWTWEKVVKQLSEIYRHVLEPQEPKTAVIIPCYNKQATLERAVKSALAQTRQPERIIIIDDGSTDESGKIGKTLAETYGIVEYHYQANAGVAESRNRGIRMCEGYKYVCCLDGDDAMEPAFLGVCLDALERDPSIHLAYTALRWVKPDGSEGISNWPGEWDFEKQVQRKNQVPTCCVYRKETFDRLGGYRSRYAPTGCGSEDAALWTQFGLHGYKCAQVSTAPLFVYSFMSGGTAQKGYNEVDWLQLYPSVHDGLHPLASYKKPVNDIAHPVFMYDEPLISVVIPVGPGHVSRIPDVLDSVESQRSFRKWEAIVVNDSGEQIPDYITKAYPYVRFAETPGEKGPGYARNRGAEMARGKFLVFMDADDMMLPDFMIKVLNTWEIEKKIIYTDYLGSAYISEEEAERQKTIGKLRSWGGGPDKLSVIGYPSHPAEIDFECERAQAMPRFPLYHWCLVTCLIPKAWHIEIGDFDEKMDSWEDVEYHWRMAWHGHCYARVPEELLLYRFAGGTRRAKASDETDSGRQIAKKLLRYISAKKERITMAPCSGCSNRRASSIRRQQPQPAVPQRVTSVRSAPPAANDSDFGMYFYIHPNRGDHRVIGGNLFPARIAGVNMRSAHGGGYRIDYGYHSGGEQKPFLVHHLDANAQPHLFKRAELIEAPPVQREAPKEPEPVDIGDFLADTEDNANPLAKFANDDDELEIDMFEDEFDPQTIPGITAPIAAQLEGKTLDDLKAMSESDWMKLKGVAEAKAGIIMRYLANLEE